MNELIIRYAMNGYDLHFNTLRTTTGLLHPQGQERIEIILLKRLPGLQKKGGSAYAKAIVNWELMRDPKGLEKALEHLQLKVDLTYKTKQQ